MMTIAIGTETQNGRPMNCGVGEAEADEGAEHHEVALGEIHGFRGLVDQHEPHARQAVDTAIRKPADDAAARRPRRSPPHSSAICRRAVRSHGRPVRQLRPRAAVRQGADEHLSVRFRQFRRHARHRLGKRHDRRDIGRPAPVRKTLLRLHDDAAMRSSRRRAAHPFGQPEALDPLVHEDQLAGLGDRRRLAGRAGHRRSSAHRAASR